MKVRSVFVSNSSSSSCVCMICNRTEEGFDLCLSDVDMISCEIGHSMCIDHIKNMSDDEENDNKIFSKNCPICTFEEIDYDDTQTYLIKKYGIKPKEIFAKIEETNKRRRRLYPYEYVEYVLKKYNLTTDNILKELKEKFQSYEEFLRSLK